MQIKFNNYAITSVSNPYYYDNPKNLNCSTIFNITICNQEVVNDSGQVANVCYGLSYTVPGTQTFCGFKRGDVVDITASLRGRWVDKIKRAENDLKVESIALSNINGNVMPSNVTPLQSTANS